MLRREEAVVLVKERNKREGSMVRNERGEG